MAAAMKPELVAWWNQAATIGAEYAKFQKRRTALAKRTASVKSAMRAEKRKLGAEIFKLLKIIDARAQATTIRPVGRRRGTGRAPRRTLPVVPAR